MNALESTTALESALTALDDDSHDAVIIAFSHTANASNTVSSKLKTHTRARNVYAKRLHAAQQRAARANTFVLEDISEDPAIQNAVKSILAYAVQHNCTYVEAESALTATAV